MKFYNKVILVGNLTENSDTRYTPSGSQVTKLRLQIDPNRESRDVLAPQIIDVITFDKDSPAGDRSFSKGSWVLVEGRIQTRSWKTMEGQKRSKLEIIAERIYPLER